MATGSMHPAAAAPAIRLLPMRPRSKILLALLLALRKGLLFPGRHPFPIHIRVTQSTINLTGIGSAGDTGPEMGAFLIVGLLSIDPTMRYLRWNKTVKAGQALEISDSEFNRTRLILRLELIGIAIILLAAPMMARGVGM